MARIQKILLLVFVLPIAYLPTLAVLISLIHNLSRFHYSVLSVFIFSALGTLSFVFHLKSFKIYKLEDSEQIFPKIDVVFWWFNVLFGVICLLSAGYFIYIIFKFFNENMPTELLVVTIPTIILGPWILLDALFLNRIMKIHKYAIRNSEIDEIRGE